MRNPAAVAHFVVQEFLHVHTSWTAGELMAHQEKMEHLYALITKAVFNPDQFMQNYVPEMEETDK